MDPQNGVFQEDFETHDTSIFGSNAHSFLWQNIISCPKSRVYSNVKRYVSKRVPHDIVVCFKIARKLLPICPSKTSPESFLFGEKRNPDLVHPSFVDTKHNIPPTKWQAMQGLRCDWILFSLDSMPSMPQRPPPGAFLNLNHPAQRPKKTSRS